MQIVKVESAFKLVAIKMPITITLIHLLAYFLFVFYSMYLLVLVVM